MDPYLALAIADPVLGRAIEYVGRDEVRTNPVTFHSVATAIIGQQLSVKAATGILARVKAGLGAEHLQPEHFRGHDPESLRKFGLSRQKSRYLWDLASKNIPYDHLADMTDGDILQCLTSVNGIGDWTVQMLLIFDLGRPDVMPAGDLGIQEGIRILDGLDARPKPQEVLARSERWRPHRTYAARTLWRLKDAR